MKQIYLETSESLKEMELEINEKRKKMSKIMLDLVQNYVVEYNGKIFKDFDIDFDFNFYLFELAIKIPVTSLELKHKSEVYEEDNVVCLSTYKQLKAA